MLDTLLFLCIMSLSAGNGKSPRPAGTGRSAAKRRMAVFREGNGRSCMEKMAERAMLYDFYGDLLTDRQKEIFGYVVNQDLSLSEIAGICGISRQAAHDVISRCDRILAGYEGKLHLVERFLELKKSVGSLHEEMESYAEQTGKPLPESAERLFAKIRDEL
jgi:predicted DNA-binding protein YlxM (UPF0122 family)